MLDIKLIREEPEVVKLELAKVGFEPSRVDELLEADARRRASIRQVEELRAERARISRRIGKIQEEEERRMAAAESRKLGERLGELERARAQAQDEFHKLMLEVPNLPHPDVPVGRDEGENVILRTEDRRREFSFSPRPHWEIGESLGIIDFERGVKIAGTRYYILRGAGAHLQRALINWMIDVHVREHGYTEVYPPAMVREECLVGTGNLPKFGENLYRDWQENVWFIPTAEVPVTNMYRDEILDGSLLPMRHVAYTPCFRREKMSAGRDVRGIKRGHQFDKVEMVKFVAPDASDAELLSLLGDAEDICRRLDIPHRVVQMCTGDLSFVAAMKYDVEMWAPGVGEWLEVSSCSNFRDFQARRANIRYRMRPGERPTLVHTINGSGLALPRVVIAVIENYQRADGSVEVPAVLRPYMGGMERID